MLESKTYCAHPFRETVLLPGDTLLVCQRHTDNVIIDKGFHEAFYTGKIQEIRELMLEGKSVPGCDQCYREESVGIKSMRQKSIEKHGVVTDIEIHSIDVQFDNTCNLKCRMCASTQSHLLYNEEIEIFGNAVSWQKATSTDVYTEIDNSKINEIVIYGGEPLLSERANKFLQTFIDSERISEIKISTPTNGMVHPSDTFLTAFLSCKKLDLTVSIDAYGDLNDYFRSRSDFDTVIHNLDFFIDLINLRGSKETYVRVSVTVNVYNVNKLQELETFLRSRYTNILIDFNLLHNPDFLRISCLPKEYKDAIRHKVETYPNVLKMLDMDDTNYFEEFIFYHNKLDAIRQESLSEVNLELAEYIKNYKSEKAVTSDQVRKFYPIIDLGSSNG
jgi:sulfatase maturation enzyme AslB (radical SAM superfamily)